MTYTALLILAILRDNFARLDRQAIGVHLSGLQQLDGRYVSQYKLNLASFVLRGLLKKTCALVTVLLLLHTY